MKTLLQHTTQDLIFQIRQKGVHVLTFIAIYITAHHIIPDYCASIWKARFTSLFTYQCFLKMVTSSGIVSVNIFVSAEHRGKYMKSISLIMYMIHKSSNEIFVDFNNIHGVILLKQWLGMCLESDSNNDPCNFFCMVFKTVGIR